MIIIQLAIKIACSQFFFGITENNAIVTWGLVRLPINHKDFGSKRTVNKKPSICPCNNNKIIAGLNNASSCFIRLRLYLWAIKIIITIFIIEIIPLPMFGGSRPGIIKIRDTHGG